MAIAHSQRALAFVLAIFSSIEINDTHLLAMLQLLMLTVNRFYFYVNCWFPSANGIVLKDLFITLSDAKHQRKILRMQLLTANGSQQVKPALK